MCKHPLRNLLAMDGKRSLIFHGFPGKNELTSLEINAEQLVKILLKAPLQINTKHSERLINS